MKKYKWILVFTVILTVFSGYIFIAQAEEGATTATTTLATTTLAQISVQIDKPAILPDSPFYFIKRAGEGIINFFTFGKINQAKRALELSGVRLAESKFLIEKNKTDLAEKINQEYQSQLQKALNLAQEAKQDEKTIQEAEGVIQDISKETLNNQVVMLQVMEKAPEKSISKAQDALQMSIKVRTQAIQELPQGKRLEVEYKDSTTIGVLKSRIDEFKKEGLIFDKSVNDNTDINPKEIILNGKLVEGGVECQRFETNSGNFYTLVGLDKNEFKNEDRVLIKGEIQKISICQQDTTIKVDEIKKLSVGEENICKEASDCGKPLVCPDGKTYPAWSCNDGKCGQINYFRDPCSTIPSSKPYIHEIAPRQGVVGSRVTIEGSGFSATGNTIMFSSGAIPNVDSKSGTVLAFMVPGALTPLCFYQKLPCLMMSKKVTPGKYEVLVKNNNGTSNSVIFEVVDSEPRLSVIPSVECKVASDCGKPLVCPDGKTYPAWSCNDGKCGQIAYFRDPCSTTTQNGAIISFTIDPSTKASGWTMYNTGANVILKGKNLKSVKVWSSPTGTEAKNALIGEMSKISESSESDTWQLKLPPYIMATNFWAEAADFMGRQVKSEDLGQVGYEESR